MSINNDIAILKYSIEFDFKCRRSKNGCIYFKGCKNKKGYGIFHNPWERAAHRFSWFRHRGMIPKGLMVLHKCDTPKCINIDHLFLGTAADNTADMMKKGRHKPVSIKGEDSATSKITEKTAKQIIKLLEKRKTPLEVSKKLNVSKHIVHDINSGKTWKHLKFKKPEPIILKKECIICSELFRVKPYQQDSAKYCSQKCYWESLRDNLIINCIICEKSFKDSKSRARKYCSQKCYKEFRRSK